MNPGGCPNVSPINLPTWYQYLSCDSNNTPQFNGLNDVWLIVLAIFEMIVYIGSIAAVIYMIVGGIQYITSQGAPDKTAQARRTITFAIVGLVVTIIARTVVRFIGNQLGAPDIV